MKKKSNAKAKSAEQAEKRKAAIEENERRRLEAIAAAKAEEERKKAEAGRAAELAKKQRIREDLILEDNALARSGKSKVKAAGLKSTFTIAEDELIMTSFGRGNHAILEKRIIGDEIMPIAAEQSLSVRANKESYLVRGRIPEEAEAGNPLWISQTNTSPKKSGTDLIECRPQLEKLFFGREFEDNIHIQLIYNILDIDKILSIHINNIVYELNNMLRRDGNDYDDLIGYLGLEHDYVTFMNPELFIRNERTRKTVMELRDLFVRLMEQRQLGYFGTVLRDDKLYKLKDRSEREEALARKQQDSYYILCMIGMLRQALAHGGESTRVSIYKLDPIFDNGKNERRRAEARSALDELYGKRVKTLNGNFIDKAKKDLKILFEVLDVKDVPEKKRITRDYYDFIVRKEYKNRGFSVKQLRETMIDRHCLRIREEIFDSVRAKLNRTFDFVIFEHYQQNAPEEEKLVNRLRASLDEADKMSEYFMEADRLWKVLDDVVNKQILPKMDGEYIANLTNDADVNPEMLEDCVIGTDALFFSKLMYLLCNFLDGKEINDLLTTLINKFENIAEFIATMNALGIPCEFTKDYEMFSESARIAKELRTINSFARMTEPEPFAKKIMYVEAAELLGFPESGDVSDRVDKILDGKSGKEDNGFRNFIANNVVESNRFKYLVRYGNAKNLRRLADNKTVIRFVLKDIPDAQILRYYNSVMGTNYGDCADWSWIRDELAKIITGVSFEEFADVHQQNGGTAEQRIDKERKKSVVRLYLTVLYLLTKNLVYVNSRYFLAFHCAERDAMITDPEKYRSLKGDLAAYARDFVNAHGKNRRAQQYLKQNFENSDPWAVTSFRNCTMHLNAIRNADKYIGDIRGFSSYFELYHYLTQRTLKDQFVRGCKLKHITEEQVNSRLRAYWGLVEKHGTYCKDMVKALNVAFAYNLPRYKNLSIDALFDRNRPGAKGEGRIDKPAEEE